MLAEGGRKGGRKPSVTGLGSRGVMGVVFLYSSFVPFIKWHNSPRDMKSHQPRKGGRIKRNVTKHFRHKRFLVFYSRFTQSNLTKRIGP